MIKLKISILIVEDDLKIRRLLKDYLENENYEVTEAENGKEALDKFFNGKFDLVVLDWNVRCSVVIQNKHKIIP